MTLNEFIAKAQAQAPVHIEGLARDLGVPVNREFLDDGISGELVKTGDDTYEINVNVLDPLTRQRFTIAHELGHYIYHRSLIGDGVDDDRAYRSTQAGRYHNTRIGPRQETEANRFAATVLMPDHLLDELESLGYTTEEKAMKLQVSKQALCIRLGIPIEP